MSQHKSPELICPIGLENRFLASEEFRWEQKPFLRVLLMIVIQNDIKNNSTMVIVPPQMMLSIGLQFVGFYVARVQNVSNERNEDRFIFMYGAFPDVFSIIFREIQDVAIAGNTTINKANPKHFLMCLCWLNNYRVETAISAVFGYHKDTVRKWIWKYARAIQ
jgi:hypothetical protein